MKKICIACGMPMEKPEDYAMGDPARDYCRFCQREDGTMQGYEEKRQGLIRFAIEAQGLDEGVAARIVEAQMRTLPAWRERP